MNVQIDGVFLLLYSCVWYLALLVLYSIFRNLEEDIFRTRYREEYYTLKKSRTSLVFCIIRNAIWIYWCIRVLPSKDEALNVLFLIPFLLLTIDIPVAMNRMVWRINVTADCLEIHRPFKKKRIIYFSKIDSVRLKEKTIFGFEYVTTIIVYSKGKVAFKFSNKDIGHKHLLEKLRYLLSHRPHHCDRSETIQSLTLVLTMIAAEKKEKELNCHAYARSDGENADF